MAVSSVASPREEAALNAYNEYKQTYCDCPDSASLDHSLSILDEFVALEIARVEPRVSFTTLTLEAKDNDVLPTFQTAEGTGPDEIDEVLSTLYSDSTATKKRGVPRKATFLIVENLCPETMVKLGQALRVPPQFWSEYIEDRPWFWKQQITPQWLDLPSTRATLNLIKTQWIMPRPFSWLLQDNGVFGPESFSLKSDNRTSRLERIAGVLIPRTGDKEPKAPVAFIREKCMVWMNRLRAADHHLIGNVCVRYDVM